MSPNLNLNEHYCSKIQTDHLHHGIKWPQIRSRSDVSLISDCENKIRTKTPKLIKNGFHLWFEYFFQKAARCNKCEAIGVPGKVPSEVSSKSQKRTAKFVLHAVREFSPKIH